MRRANTRIIKAPTTTSVKPTVAISSGCDPVRGSEVGIVVELTAVVVETLSVDALWGSDTAGVEALFIVGVTMTVNDVPGASGESVQLSVGAVAVQVTPEPEETT